MSSKTIGAQRPFKMLVPALQGSTDPSKGPSGNPVYKWKTFEQQILIERPGANRVIQSGKTPGLGNRTGILLTGTPPAPATGTIDVVGNTFVGPTSILLGAYTLTSGTDFQIGSIIQAVFALTVTAAPSTATIDFGFSSLVPAGGARTPGLNDYDNTLGSTNAIATEIAAALADGANGFGPFFTVTSVVGPVVTITAVPLGSAGNFTITPSTGTVTAATVTVGLDAVESTAVNLAASIDALPEYAASAIGAQVSVSGQVFEITLFDAGGACPYNFSLTPDSGTLTGGAPHIGPPTLSL